MNSAPKLAPRPLHHVEVLVFLVPVALGRVSKGWQVYSRRNHFTTQKRSQFYYFGIAHMNRSEGNLIIELEGNNVFFAGPVDTVTLRGDSQSKVRVHFSLGAGDRLFATVHRSLAP